jgi:hypothetical protein
VPTQSVTADPPESTSADAWNQKPYEAQYLKVYDITAPTATPGQPEKPKAYAYEIGDKVTFDWDDVAPDGGGVVPHYEVTVTVNGSSAGTFTTSQSQYEVVANEGDEVSITIKAVNPDYTSNAGPASSASETVSLLAAGDDEDSDGMSNVDEDIAGTNPLDVASIFKIASNGIESDGDFTITWDAVAGRTYAVQVSTTLAEGSWTTIDSNLSSGTWTDPNPTEDKKFYRVVVE